MKIRRWLLRSLMNESGQSLVVALVLTSAMTISIAGTISFMTGSESSFGRDRQSDRSFDIAEAGLNNGLAVIANKDPNNLLSSWGTNYTNVAVDGGKVSYSMTKSGSTWTITATSTSPDGKVTRRVQQQVAFGSRMQTVDASAVYGDGLFISGNSGCTNLTGNMTLNANIWVNNDLCITGSTVLTPSQANKYALYVGGQYKATGSIAAGSSSFPLSSATVVGGCNVVGGTPPSAGSVICSSSSASHIYANSYSSSPSTAHVKPTIDAAAVYSTGDWDSASCSTGSFTFDSDGTRNGTTNVTRPGDVSSKNNPIGGSSYSCTIPKAGGGGNVGSLAWDNTTKTLTINGTIWIDGNINLVGNYNAKYAGNGTIYVNGVVSETGTVYVCGPGSAGSGAGSCNGTLWNPSLGQLGMVAINPSGASSGYQFTGNGQWDLTALAVGAIVNTGNVVMTGPVIADSGSFTGNMGFIIPGTPPTGAPATTTTSVSGWAVVPGSWKQLQ